MTTNHAISDAALDAAHRAFRIGPPGVLRSVEQVDSYPGDFPGDPEGYAPLPTTHADERAAIADAIAAALSHLFDEAAVKRANQSLGYCDGCFEHALAAALGVKR